MTLIDENCLFIGSRLSDSILLQFTCNSICVDVTGKQVTPEDNNKQLVLDESKVNSDAIYDASEEVSCFRIFF